MGTETPTSFLAAPSPTLVPGSWLKSEGSSSGGGPLQQHPSNASSTSWDAVRTQVRSFYMNSSFSAAAAKEFAFDDRLNRLYFLSITRLPVIHTDGIIQRSLLGHLDRNQSIRDALTRSPSGAPSPTPSNLYLSPSPTKPSLNESSGTVANAQSAVQVSSGSKCVTLFATPLSSDNAEPLPLYDDDITQPPTNAGPMSFDTIINEPMQFQVQMDPQDPKIGGSLNDLISFVRKQDLWVTTADGVELKLTHSIDEHVSNGVAEYIMQEEFHRYTGYWWAPKLEKSDDSIALRHTDGSDSDSKNLIDFMEDVTSNNGTEPSQLQERILYLEVDERNVETVCIARAGFDGDVDKYRVWFQLLDRRQQRSALVEVPECLFMTEEEYVEAAAKNFFGLSQIRVLVEERSEYWINVTDVVHFISKPEAEETLELIWASEKTGYRHLYHITFPAVQPLPSNPEVAFSVAQHLSVRRITCGEWQVMDHEIWVDEARGLVYFMGKKDTPLESHLYRSSYSRALQVNSNYFGDFSNEGEASGMVDRSQRLTVLGKSHQVSMNSSCTLFVSTSSSVTERPVFEVFSLTPMNASAPVPESAEGLSGGLAQDPLDHHQHGIHHAPKSQHSRAVIEPTAATSNNSTITTRPITVTLLLMLKQPVSPDSGYTPDSDEKDQSSFEANMDYEKVSGTPIPTFATDMEDKDPPHRASDTHWPWKPRKVTIIKPKDHLPDNGVISTQLPEPEFFSFINSAGVEIFGMLYKPPNFSPTKKYPVLLRIYGGPNVQICTNDYKYPKFMRVFLALKFGYVVAMIDSRGSYDRGMEFEGYIKGRMGTVELQDQIEGLLYLSTRTEPYSSRSTMSLLFAEDKVKTPAPGRLEGCNEPGWSAHKALENLRVQGTSNFMDLNNIFITGWSYGGYLSLMAL
ncbi:dipeptidylpeptidase, partial [Chytridiales sp. JEL 0842]